MQLVFTEDIRGENGDLKFLAGEVKDWPKTTWLQVAKTLQMPLESFTQSIESALASKASLEKVNEPVKVASGRRRLRASP